MKPNLFFVLIAVFVLALVSSACQSQSEDAPADVASPDANHAQPAAATLAGNSIEAMALIPGKTEYETEEQKPIRKQTKENRKERG